jgi:hypothetical protein
MSTAGIYASHPKVDQPHKIFQQMRSDQEMPAFFFGGSQVPIQLGIPRDGSHQSEYKQTMKKVKEMGISGNGIKTHYEHTQKIIMPKHMPRI